MKVVMTLVTEYQPEFNRVTVYQRHNHKPDQRDHYATFSYDPEKPALDNHEYAARRWLELRESGRTLLPYAHQVSGGYYFGMV